MVSKFSPNPPWEQTS